MSQSAVATQPATTPRNPAVYPVLSAEGLAPITVEHPAWCGGKCPVKVMLEGVREAVHSLDAFKVEIQHPRGTRTAVVAFVRIDEWAPDGTRTSDGVTDIVLDGPEGTLCLSAEEAAQLASALFSASLQAR